MAFAATGGWTRAAPVSHPPAGERRGLRAGMAVAPPPAMNATPLAGAGSRLADAAAAQDALALCRPAIAPLVGRADVCGTGCLCIVVLDPARSPQPGHLVTDAVLLEAAIGRPREQWDADYAAYARAKAALSWRTGRHGSEVIATRPQLIDAGEAALPGGVCLEGIVVAASGAMPWWDELFALWVAASLRSVAHRRQQQG